MLLEGLRYNGPGGPLEGVMLVQNMIQMAVHRIRSWEKNEKQCGVIPHERTASRRRRWKDIGERGGVGQPSTDQLDGVALDAGICVSLGAACV